MGDIFQDRRQPGHRDVVVSQPNLHQTHISSKPIPQEDIPDDSPLPSIAMWDIAITERHAQLLVDLRQGSAMTIPRSIVSHYATAWGESIEGALTGHQSWALLCRRRCRLLLAEVPDGSDRNAELKQRLQLWEAGEVHDLI